MRKALGFVILALALAPPAAAQERSVDSPERLMERLTAAMDSADVEALDSLHEWEGVDAKHAAALRAGFETRFFACQGRPTQLHPSPPGTEDESMVRGGFVYRPNLAIEGRIEIVCTSGKRASFTVPYGQRDGRYLLSNVVREASH